MLTADKSLTLVIVWPADVSDEVLQCPTLRDKLEARSLLICLRT